MKYIILTSALTLMGCDATWNDMEYGRCIEVCLQKSSTVEHHVPGACICKGTDIVIRLKSLPKSK